MWMTNKINSLFKCYHSLSVTTKSTIWFAICNILQKAAAFLLIPILTRELTTLEYGTYSVFLSWQSILEIIATFHIYANGFVAGLIKNAEDSKSYTCSMCWLCCTITTITLFLYLLIRVRLNQIIQLPTQLMLFMFLSFYSTAVINLWCSLQRTKYNYKRMTVQTIFYSIVATIIAIVAMLRSFNKLYTFIIVKIISQTIMAIPIFFSIMAANKCRIKWKYCVEALKFNFPLLPYYLSMILLSNSDRIIIQRIIGLNEAGIYSVAYSLSMSMFVFTGALNLSFQPLMFTNLKERNDLDNTKMMNNSIIIVAIINLCLLLVSPEIVVVMASEKYKSVIWVMPPIIGSVLVMFIYQQILNILFFYKKTQIIFLSSMLAMGVNILLNYALIPRFGFVVAGYTTLFSYILVGTLYLYEAIKVCQNNCVQFSNFFNLKYILFILAIYFLVTFLIMVFYEAVAVRYVCLVIIICLLFVKMKRSLKNE